MNFDLFESTKLDAASSDVKGKMAALRSGLESSLKPTDGVYSGLPKNIDSNIMHWLDISPAEGVDVSAIRPLLEATAKEMYEGITPENKKNTHCLKDINNWHINREYKYQNLKQHAGFAAEVIGTAKENMLSELNGTGIKTYRADDRRDLFAKNDQFVDKVRVDGNGAILEKVQVKFVGKNAQECFDRLTSKKFDKYYIDGRVDKIEIPKDYYDGVKKLIPEKLGGLREQLDHVKESGNAKAVDSIEARIEKLQKLDQMLEKSTVESHEAVEAVKHPKRYTEKLFVDNPFTEGHKLGVENARFAAALTAAISTVDDVSKVMDGTMTPQEAFIDVVKDTGVAGAAAYGTTFISTAVSQTMSASGHQLIRSLGNAGVPAMVISFGVESFDSVVDFANGTIDGQQLAYDLVENAVQVGGSIAGSALAGAAVGSLVPGAGTAVGFGAGLVGGVVGCAVASEAYASAIEIGAEQAEILADKAQEMADRTVEIATEVVPEKAGEVVSAINDFAEANNLPFRV